MSAAIHALCLGEVLIDFVPTVTGRDLRTAEAFQKAPGGAPANVAVGLARLGGSLTSGMIAKVGDDGFGRFLVQTLADAGVDTALVRSDPANRTPLAFVSLAEDGDREFLFYGEPWGTLAPADIDHAAVAAAGLLHFGSVGLIGQSSRAATWAAADTASANGLTVSFDANLRPALWPDLGAARAAIAEGVARSSVVKLSDEELAFLTGSDDPAAGRALWHDRMRALVVTHGAKGSTCLTRDGQVSVGGFTVQAVDTTGAGDAFMAAFLSGLLTEPDAPVEGLCRFANAAGALATTRRGAIPAMPTRAEVEALLGEVRL
ncbi:PfkB family carbohydrate kinase [Azospirillum sp. TSO35-2]|uniref:PfkB family carbohydrate kinase n=1 Tax=Azospirillum sp. TSO35-2 TaxID=716796 RepID=UPI000D620B85|nr:PfkB family carbohydrate kinase [Azospirillum sp. TSO35-2]PWC39834.1 hypothetical protein TSO352_07090 [Azospirillum sp. TSO35-2]